MRNISNSLTRQKTRSCNAILPHPVKAGNQIRVKTNTDASAVTDSSGNTYTNLPESTDKRFRFEWRARNSPGGDNLIVSVLSEIDEVIEVKVEEWEEEQ